jgi:hypothetical protein
LECNKTGTRPFVGGQDNAICAVFSDNPSPQAVIQINGKDFATWFEQAADIACDATGKGG